MNASPTPPPRPAHPAPRFNTATAPAIRPDYSAEQRTAWLARHEEFLAAAGRDEADLLFLGDSLTDHWRSRGLAAWARLLGPLRALNFGLAGDRTQQLLWRIEHGKLERLSPRATLVLIGTNNLDPGFGEPSLTPRNSPDEIVAGILSVVDAIALQLPLTMIVLQAVFPRGGPASAAQTAIDLINDDLRTRVARRAGVRLVDFGPGLLAQDTPAAAIFLPDRLHLTEGGYDAWGRALAACLSDLGMRVSPESRRHRAALEFPLPSAP